MANYWDAASSKISATSAAKSVSTTEDGKLGVGTKSPVTKLDVQGNVRTKNALVEPEGELITGWINDSSGLAYEIFTVSGNKIVSASDSVGTSKANSKPFSLIPGCVYTINSEVTLFWGQCPAIYLNDATLLQTLVVGTNIIKFKATTETFITIRSAGATNYSATISLTNPIELTVSGTIQTTKLNVTIPFSKTDSTLQEVSYLGKSNDSSCFSALQIEMQGDSSAENRCWLFQTIEDETATNGILSLQPFGGRVGIGTVNPEAILSINAPDSHILLSDSSSLGIIQISNNSLQIGNWIDLTKTISINMDSGYVGIGTTNPQASLEVNNSNPYIAYFIRPSAGPSILIGGNSTNAFGSIHYNYESSFLGLGTYNYNDSLVIKSGKIGIGTITPSSGLELGAGKHLTLTSADLTATNGEFNWTRSSTNPSAIITQSGTGDILNLMDGNTKVFIVTDGGNVGIGSSNPQTAKLEVTGNVLISGTINVGDVSTSGILKYLTANTSPTATVTMINTINGNAMPAPVGYLKTTVSGVTYKVPYYNN